MIKNKMLELHIIQNFAPSNLNRNDIGEPKNCIFGGTRRARISSQCFKREMRNLFDEGDYFSEEQKNNLAKRTKLLLTEILEGLVEEGKDEEVSKQIATIALNAGKLNVKDNGKTEYLLFLGKDEIRRIVKFCLDNWEVLSEVNSAYETTREIQREIETLTNDAKLFKSKQREELNKIKDSYKGDKEKIKEESEKIKNRFAEKVDENKEQIRKLRDKKNNAEKAAKASIPTNIKSEFVKILDGGKAADLALFGRMIANLPKNNVDGSSQFSHLLSTHTVDVEFDFFTALDDLQKEEDSGAGMLDVIQYNSACFYRYANVDVELLYKNLNEKDYELTKATTEAFIRTMIEAIPKAKQNSFSTHENPSFVLAIVRDAGFCSLANAFEKPITPIGKKSLIEDSIEKLDKHWANITGVYGDESKSKACILTAAAELKSLSDANVGNLETLIKNTLNTIFE